MGVEVQRHGHAGVAETFAYYLPVDPLLKHQGGVGVSGIVEPNTSEACLPYKASPRL